MLSFKDKMWAMSIALEEAARAYDESEVPVGACILDNDGKLVAQGRNSKEKTNDPTGHAEINVIKSLSEKLGNWRLTDYHLFVTLEPCVMCAGACVHSRFSSVNFGAYDPKGGFKSLGYNLEKDPKLNHHFAVMGGLKQKECSRLLSQFFREKRNRYKYAHKS